MKDIIIKGLSTEQVEMLDIMWGLDSGDEFNDWIETLSKSELRMALILKELLLAYYLDEFNEIDIAKDYLEKFRT